MKKVQIIHGSYHWHVVDNETKSLVRFMIGTWWYLDDEEQTIYRCDDRNLLIEYVAIGRYNFSPENKFYYDTVFDDEEIDYLAFPGKGLMDCVVARSGDRDFTLYQISHQIMPEEVATWKENRK